MAGENLSNTLAEVRAIYQELARRPVQRNCIARTECCQFQLTGLTPHLTKGEALLAAKAFRATGRKELPEADDRACPMLKRETGRCMIYADRPLSLIHISEPTRLGMISYAVFCLKKKKQ